LTETHLSWRWYRPADRLGLSRLWEDAPRETTDRQTTAGETLKKGGWRWSAGCSKGVWFRLKNPV